jgi:nucleoside-diphosphate-sugar epimerase
MKKTALVCGGGGFIGSHIVKKLKSEGFWVRAVDLKKPDFSKSEADDFVVGDLRDPLLVSRIMMSPNQQKESDEKNSFDEVYQLAADMGGAGYIFSGDNDANVMHNSALINLNIVYEAVKKKAKGIFYSSSACIYPEHNQMDPDNPKCSEESAYPANPDSEYGWEKLLSERLYLSFYRNYGLRVRIARYHNIFGPEGTFDGGKEKAPAAICRKVIKASDGDIIEVWGDGSSIRDFIHAKDVAQGMIFAVENKITKPINLGSGTGVTIKELSEIVANYFNKPIKWLTDKPSGDAKRIFSMERANSYGFYPETSIKEGVEGTIEWFILNKNIVDKRFNILNK